MIHKLPKAEKEVQYLKGKLRLYKTTTTKKTSVLL
jgi:hypothetical protein